MHFMRVRRFVVVIPHNVVDGRLRFLNRFRRLVIVILYFLEGFMFLGKSNSTMVSFTFTMSAMTWNPASVISQSPKINFLTSCSIKFGVMRFVSRVSDLLRNPLLDLLRDFLSVPERSGSRKRLVNLLLSSSIDRAS